MWNEFDRMKKMESDPKYRKQGKRRWKQFVTILSCFVVFCTAYVLIMPAAAQNTQTFCDISPHTHQNTCYDDAGVLTCKEIEHEHTRQCSSDPKAIETAEEWEATIPKNLSDDLYERTVEIARSQLGYQESKDNFRVNEDETEDGFTRYGAWVNQPYESWNNAFTGWVIHYADVPIPFNRDISAWAEGAESDLEKVKAGDILFFDRNEQLHSGIVTDVEENGEEKIITVIAGDIDHSVKEYKPKTDEIRGAVDLKEGLAFCGQVSHVHTEECYKSKEPLCGQDENDSKEELVEEPSEPAEEIEPQSETEMPVSEEEPGAEVSEGEEAPEADNESEPVELAEEIENAEAAEPVAEEPHEHSDECYVSQELQCGKEEHTHTRECQSNPNAVETEEDWKKSLPAELKADLNERVLQVAESQLEYTESRENFRINADQSESSYSRFGAWAGDPYGEWNNYFTGFVLNYAGSEVAFENDLGLWINQLQDKLKEKAEPGDVVIFNDANGILYSGIVKEVAEDHVTVIQGDVEGSVKTAEINKTNCISFVSPGNTTDEDKNASAEGKSVTINGVKEVGVGDEVVLSADPSGFNGEVKYQWQYKDGDEDWKNLEQGNEQKLFITITEENINWLFRVGVTDNHSSEKSISSEGETANEEPVTAALQFHANLLDSSQKNVDTDPNEEDVIYSPSLSFSSKESVSAQESTTSKPKFVITKGWMQSHDSINEITVNVYHKDRKEGDKPYKSVSFGKNENSNKWEGSIEMDAGVDLDDFIIEEEPIPGWKATYDTYDSSFYTKNVWAESSDLNDGAYLVTDSKMEYCLALESDKLVIKKISDMNIDDKFDINSYPSTAKWSVSSDIFHIGNSYLKINQNKLSITKRKLDATSFSYSSNTGLYNRTGGWLSGYIYNYVQITDSNITISNSNSNIRLYKSQAKSLPLVRNVLITNGPNYGSSVGDTTGDEALVNGFPISKKIDYLGDKIENPDAGISATDDVTDLYRLYLSAGPIAGDAAATPVNVLYVIDTSTSMNNSNRYIKAKTAVIDSWKAVSKLNPNSKRAVISFDWNSKVVTDWSSNNIENSMFQNKLEVNKDKLPSDKATNYVSALNAANVKINEIKNNGYPTFMIFLSDGTATTTKLSSNDKNGVGNGSAEAGNTDDVINATRDGIFNFRMNQPDVNISVIGLDYTDNHDYFKMLATGGQVYNASADTVIKQMTAIIAGPTLTHGEIIDTLTADVNFAANPNVKLVAIEKKTGKSQVMWDSQGYNPDLTLIKMDNTPERFNDIFDASTVKDSPPYVINGQKIVVKFKSSWSMNTKYEYVLSFNIKVNDAAYSRFDKEGYDAVGDDLTDYDDEHKTSSGMEGFYSNEDNYVDANNKVVKNTAFAFEYNNKPYVRSYQKPVVQVHRTIKIYKVDLATNKPLGGAKFTLYSPKNTDSQVNKDMPGEEYDAGIPLVTNPDEINKGYITLPDLPTGIYYLKETDAPEGYLLPNDVWKLTIGPGVTISGENCELITSTSSNREYVIKISNIAGKPLPSTGGSGTQLYTSGGIALMASGLLMYGYVKRSKKKRE